MRRKLNKTETDNTSTPPKRMTIKEKREEETSKKLIERITKVKERLRKNSNYDWQPDEVVEIIATGIDILETDKDVFSMLGVAAKLGLYNTWFKRMREKYPNEKQVIEGLKMLKDLCEYKTHQYAASGKINPAVGIFSLKAYHKRVEQQYVKVDSDNKHNHSGEVNITLREPDGSIYKPNE